MDSVPSTLYTFDQSVRILDLAIDYLSINPSEKEKIIKLLEKKFQDHSDINLTEIFRQEHLISDEKIEYSSIFDTHLQTLYLDQQFGRLAIVNGLASEEDIAVALKDQQTSFIRYRINTTIGDILVENKKITQSDRISILLTQNRIKDENLLDALNEIGTTLLQKEAVNKRFAALAIKKEFVTIEQVNTALEIQKKERSTKEKSRFIGQILRETAGVSDNDILQVLLEQKQFEKRRLDLEKALYTVKSEIKISKKLNQLFEYRIAKDGTEVFVKKIKKTDQVIQTYEFLIWLRRAGIKFGIVNDAVLEEFIQKAEKNIQIMVAKGYPAEQSINESIEFYFDNENKCDGLDAERKKGSLLAQIIPGKEGKPGKDVLGLPILPDKPSICLINAGAGVIKKGLCFLAQIDGCPVLKKDMIHMVELAAGKDEIKTIKGNISEDTGDSYESADVEVTGNITQEAILRCRSLVLHGNLTGSVICTGGVDVKGDIGIDEKPKDKDTARQASIVCRNSVKASKSVVNTKIQTADEFLASNSTVKGSDIIAFKGMTIKDVCGSSVLQFGLKPGDKIIATDHLLEMKNAALSVLKKEIETNELTEEYRKDLEKEENHLNEQTVLKNLVEIIEAPELYHQEGLDNKIRHLDRLPDFSSIKSYYLKLPETESALAFRNQMLASIRDMPPENVLSHIRKNIDPEPGDEKTESPIYLIETQFKGRFAALQREIADKSEEIEKIENEIKRLQDFRIKLQSIHVGSLSRDMSEIKIKNMCEKGTIIKGKIARLVVEKTLYNIRFREIVDLKTKAVSIHIET